jgi:hypothetical protein
LKKLLVWKAKVKILMNGFAQYMLTFVHLTGQIEEPPRSGRS